MPRNISPRRPKSQRSPPPSLHYTARSRSFQPIPVEGVPPRSPNLDFGRCVKSAGRLTAATHKGRIISQQQTYMSYIEQFEQELIAKLNGERGRSIHRSMGFRESLESYRNGITAGRKGHGEAQGAKPQARF